MDPRWQRRRFSKPRDWESSATEPFSEVPDICRGEHRLAAEVALAQVRGEVVPHQATVRALQILSVLAAA